MAEINLSLEGDIDKVSQLEFNVEDAIELALIKIWLKVQNQAKLNAPYQTGTLRRSISTDFSKIKRGMVVVGSPVAYARRREFQNFKNPHRRFYLKRAYEMQQAEIGRIITEALDRELQ